MSDPFDSQKIDPRSPVQKERSAGPYLLAALVAAIAIWTVQQTWIADQDDREPVREQERVQGQAGPASDLRTLFSADDYPASALRNGEEGTVQARLSVDEGGRVTGCAVIRSSGHSSLDDATCNILVRRARFRPAQDANGRAVPTTVDTPPISWRLEG